MNSGPKRHNSAIGGDEKQWQCEEISRSRRKWVWNKWVRKGWQGSSVPRSNRITTAGQRSNTGLKETMDETKNTQDTMTTHCLQCYWKQKRQSLGAGSHNKLALQVTCAHMCLHIITLLWRVRYWEKFTMVCPWVFNGCIRCPTSVSCQPVIELQTLASVFSWAKGMPEQVNSWFNGQQAGVKKNKNHRSC